MALIACDSAVSPSTGDDGAAGGDQATNGDAAAATARLVADPTSFDIGAIDPGAHKLVDLTITNMGPDTSGAISVDLGPGLSSSEGGMLSALTSGGRNYFSFTIAPTSGGPFSSFVSFTADPGANPPLRIPVNAVVAPWGPFMVSPLRVYLGTVIYGSNYRVTVEITAREDLSDLTVKLSELLTVDPDSTCSAVLARDESCQLVLSFYVGRPGPVGADATISATGSTSKVVMVEISGATSTDW